MKGRKLIIASLGVVVLIAAGVFALNKINHIKYFCAPSPGGCSNPDLRHTDQLEYQKSSSYYLLGTGGYECSKPIRLLSNTLDKTGKYIDFHPVDQDEANLFCHLNSAEEYKGKIKVLQRPEVLKLVSQYPYKNESIKALEFKYIKDTDYVHRLLPAFKDREIGCIIVLHTPGQAKVYLEDEKLETFEELDYKTFAGYLAAVNPADRQLFYDNLK